MQFHEWIPSIGRLISRGDEAILQPNLNSSVGSNGLPAKVEEIFQAALSVAKCVPGITSLERSHYNHLVEQGLLVRPYPGIYAIRSVWDRETTYTRTYQLVRTLAQVHPEWVFCGPTAAVIHGLSISNRYLKTLHISTGTGQHKKNSRFITWHADGNRKVEIVGGVRVTPCGRTAFDCIRYLRFPDALAVADSVARVMNMGPTQLLGMFAAEGRGCTNMRYALEVARHADARAENGGESLVRAAIIELGFMVPELQEEVVDPIDGGVRRVDFLWRLPDGRLVIGEFDGRNKYLDGHGGDKPSSRPATSYTVGKLAKERVRESRLTAAASVMRLSPSDVVDLDRMENILVGFRITREYERRVIDSRKRVPAWARY